MFKTSEGKVKKGKIELPKEIVKGMGKESDYIMTYDSDKHVIIISTHDDTDKRDADIVTFRNLVSQVPVVPVKKKKDPSRFKGKLLPMVKYKDFNKGLFIYQNDLYFKYSSNAGVEQTVTEGGISRPKKKFEFCYNLTSAILTTFRRVRLSELKNGETKYTAKELADNISYTMIQPVSLNIKKDKEGQKK